MSAYNVDEFKQGGPVEPKIQRTNTRRNKNKNDNMFIFLSFDICNSTEMKDYVKNWKEVIVEFYRTEFEFKYMSLWKFVGDEIVFYIPYHGIYDFVSLIQFAYRKIGTLQEALNKKIKTKSDPFTINIKGTMWIAYISETDIKKTVRMQDFDEFIGKQIDEGFRMSNFSSGGKLLLDPKIVFILLTLFCIDAIESPNNSYSQFSNQFLENVNKELRESIKKNIDINTVRNMISDVVKNVYFVRYENLKGIWNYSPYPIYWYFESKDRLKYFESEPISLLSGQTNPVDTTQNKFYSKDLLKVFQTVQTEKDILDIFRLISKNKKFSTSFSRHGLAQLYYSIACIKDNKVLIAQRSYERKHLRGVWEFGFQKHNDTGIKENIAKFFKTEFNLNVKLITDGTSEENIIPLHFCATYRNNLKHNSILCCAEILDDTHDLEELKKNINEFIIKKRKSKQYLKVDFVDESDVKDKFVSLNAKEIEEDSYYAQIGEHKEYNVDSSAVQHAIMYFDDSIKAALSFFKNKKNNSDGKWYDLF